MVGELSRELELKLGIAQAKYDILIDCGCISKMEWPSRNWNVRS